MATEFNGPPQQSFAERHGLRLFGVLAVVGVVMASAFFLSSQKPTYACTNACARLLRVHACMRACSHEGVHACAGVRTLIPVRVHAYDECRAMQCVRVIRAMCACVKCVRCM